MSSAVTDTTVKDAFDALRAAAARHGAPHANLRALMQGTAGRGRGGGVCTLRGVLSAVSRAHPLLTHPVHAVVAGGRELRVQCLSERFRERLRTLGPALQTLAKPYLP